MTAGVNDPEAAFRRMLPELRKCGVATVAVRLAGDEGFGDVEHLDFRPTESGERARGLHDGLRDNAMAWADALNPNWSRGAGGFGTFDIDVADGTVRLKMDERVVSSETVIDQTFDLEGATHAKTPRRDGIGR